MTQYLNDNNIELTEAVARVCIYVCSIDTITTSYYSDSISIRVCIIIIIIVIVINNVNSCNRRAYWRWMQLGQQCILDKSRSMDLFSLQIFSNRLMKWEM